MKALARLTALLALLASAPASADPVTGFILAVAGNLGISAAVLTFIGKALLAFGISAIAGALFKPDIPTSSPLLQDRSVTVREPTASRVIVYGEIRIGGAIVYIDVTDDNKYLWLVVVFAAHEIQSFESFYFDEHELTLTAGAVTGPSQFNGKAWIYEHLGTDAQVADANLVAATLNWTSNHRLRGLAYAVVKLEYDPNVYPQGIPNITTRLKGKNNVYDTRTATRGWTDNAALCAADYLMDSRLGLGSPLTSINTTALNTAANTCEDTITTLAGSEDRYTCNGLIDTAIRPREIIEGLATAKAAPTVYNTGQWYVHAGSYKTPTATLGEDDFVGPLQVVTKHPRASLFNQIKGVYMSPDNDWQISDFPVVEASTYVAEDNGVVMWRDVSLPFTTSAATAQRVSLLQLNAHRRQITFKATCMLTAMDIIPADVVQINYSRYGWTNKTFEVIDWSFSISEQLALQIDLTLRETDSAIYTWSTANESAANAAPSTNLPNFATIAAPTGVGVSTFTVPTQGGDETYKALVTWTPPTDQFVLSGGLIEIQYKESADSAWLPSFFVNGALDKAEIPLLEENVSYDVRIRSYNGVVSSGWQTILNFMVLGSSGVTGVEDWGDWVAAVTATTDWGDWTSAVTGTTDWGSWT